MRSRGAAHVRARAGHKCMRVLGEQNWARPGKVRAGYDAWVLKMHTAHAGVCTVAQLCRGQGKRMGSHGAAHLDFVSRSQTRL